MTDLPGDAPLDHYPDAEVALYTYLETVARTVTTLADWETEGTLPAIRVKRIGGGDENVQTDAARISLQCYARPTAENPRASQNLARRVVLRMRELADNPFVRHHPDNEVGTLLDQVEKISGPVSRPFDDPTITVTELIYRAVVRD